MNQHLFKAGQIRILKKKINSIKKHQYLPIRVLTFNCIFNDNIYLLYGQQVQVIISIKTRLYNEKTFKTVLNQL